MKPVYAVALLPCLLALAPPMHATPALRWSSYLGGPGFDGPARMAYDPQGNVVIACQSTSASIPLPRGLNTRFGGVADVLVVKISPSNEVLWWTFYGGSDAEFPESIAVDASGNIYVAGYSGSKDFNSIGKPGGFVLSFDPAGAVRYAHLEVGAGTLDSVAVLPGGAVAASGNTYALDVTPNGLQTQFGGASDGLVIILDNRGALKYSTYLGGSGYETISGVAADPSGNLTITGWSQSKTFPGPNGTQISLAPNLNFVASLTPDLKTMRYIVAFDGFPSLQNVLAVDSSGAWITGYAGPNLPTTAKAWQPAPATQRPQGFLMHVSPTGSILYSTYISGATGGFFRSIQLDGSGNVYLGGGNNGGSFPLTPDATYKDYANGWATLVILSPSGQPLYSGLIQGNGTTSLALRPDGEIFVAMGTNLTGLGVGPAPLQPDLPGRSNQWIARYSSGIAAVRKPVIELSGISGLPLSNPPLHALSPGAAISIRGMNLSTTTGQAVAGSANLVGQTAAPTLLGGSCVEVGGARASLLSVSPQAIQMIVPARVAALTGATTAGVRVIANCQQTYPLASDIVAVPLAAASPEFYYTAAANGTPLIQTLDADTGAVVNKGDSPVVPGENVRLLVSGLGDVGVLTPGTISSGFAPVVADVQLQLGDTLIDPAAIVYAGLVGYGSEADALGVTPFNLGLFEIRFQVPIDFSEGDVPVTLTVGGISNVAMPVLRVARVDPASAAEVVRGRVPARR